MGVSCAVAHSSCDHACSLPQVEIPHALLAELLATLRHGWRGLHDDGGRDAAAAAAGVLRGVSQAGRFTLTARLLGRGARDDAAALLDELQAELNAAADGADAAAELEALRRALGAAQL